MTITKKSSSTFAEKGEDIVVGAESGLEFSSAGGVDGGVECSDYLSGWDGAGDCLDGHAVILGEDEFVDVGEGTGLG